MTKPSEVKRLIEGAGGKVDTIAKLPDGSGCMTASFPLPKDHWLYQPPASGYEDPPMPFRTGEDEMFQPRWDTDRVLIFLTRQEFAEKIRAAGRYAIRAATANGTIDDWDPDAMIQNLVIGMIGYWTTTGRESSPRPPKR